MVEQRRQTFQSQRQRDADDDLVQPDAHAKQRHDKRHRDAAGGTGEKAQPQRPGIEGADKAEIGAGQHHAFDADVEHACLFRHLLAEAGKQQRDRRGDGAEQQRAEKDFAEEPGHALGPPRLVVSMIEIFGESEHDQHDGDQHQREMIGHAEPPRRALAADRRTESRNTKPMAAKPFMRARNTAGMTASP